MNILLGILLVLFTVAATIFFTKLVKAALSAGILPKPLIWSGVTIVAVFLFLLNFGFWTSEVQRGRMDKNLTNTTSVLERLANENKELRPLVTNAPVLIAMGDKLNKGEKDMAEVRSELRVLRELLTNSITLTGSVIREQDARLGQLEGIARTGSAPTALAGDRPLIMTTPLAPLPTNPPALVLSGTSVAPTPAMSLPQPSLREQVEASWNKRLQELSAQSKKAKGDAKRAGDTATTAQRTADEAMKVATHAQRLADGNSQIATVALARSYTNAARIDDLSVRLNEQNGAIQRLLRLLENPEVSVPVPPAYQAPAPTATPAPAPTAPTPAPAAQLVMRGASSESQQIGEEWTFAVTNTVSTGTWKKALGAVPYWHETVSMTYEVGATIRRTDNEVVARNIVVAIIEQFHKSDGSSFAGKDPSDKAVHDKFVLAFVEARKKVLKGNPGWEHLVIHPRYRTGPGEGVIVKNTTVTTDNSRNLGLTPP